MLALVSAPLWYDLGRTFTKTGIYRCDFEGTVLSGRPTWRRFLALLDELQGDHQTSHRYRGHYIAKLRDASGEVLEVAISRTTFSTTATNDFLVCRKGRVKAFRSREAAVKAGVVDP